MQKEGWDTIFILNWANKLLQIIWTQKECRETRKRNHLFPSEMRQEQLWVFTFHVAESHFHAYLKRMRQNCEPRLVLMIPNGRIDSCLNFRARRNRQTTLEAWRSKWPITTESLSTVMDFPIVYDLSISNFTIEPIRAARSTSFRKMITELRIEVPIFDVRPEGINKIVMY